MKNNNRNPYSLSQIQLQFRAISASFKNTYLNRNFKMYLQRQAQIIGEIKTLFSHSRLKAEFPFPNDQQPVSFRILRLLNSVYHIALYQVDVYDHETFIQVVQLPLTKFIEQYHKQLLKCEEDVWNQLNKDLEKTTLPQIWRALSNNISRKTFTYAVKFKNVEVVVQTNINAINKYDKQVKLDDQVQKKKKQDKKQTKLKYEFGRSKTAPSIPQISFTPQNQQHFESEVLVLNKRATLEPDFARKQEAGLITSLSIPSLKFNLNKIQEVQEVDNQPDEETNNKVQKNRQNQQNHKKIQHNFYQGAQQLKQSAQCLKQAEKKLQAQNSQFYAIHTVEGTKPDIEVKAYRLLKNPEVSEVYENVRSLFMESGVQNQDEHVQEKKSVVRGWLIWIYLLAFIAMIYWLMHPLSKL